MTIQRPCDNCPWRLANQGKRTPWGFYNKTNLRRLWRQIRGGGAMQSCHPTDPSHPDHIAAGAKPGSTPRECPGSVILVVRELCQLQRMAEERGSDAIDVPDITRYLKQRRKGLTRSGLLYYLISRTVFGGKPLIGEPVLPDVDVDDKTIGLPPELADG